MTQTQRLREGRTETDAPEETAETEEWEESREISKQRVERLLQRRREQLTDDHVTEYDFISDEGRKIQRVKIPGPDGTSKTRDVDLTAISTAGPSTTSDMEILLIEAEIAADGKESMNPHIPATDQILERAEQRIAEKGLTPAWEVVDDE